MKRVSFGLRMWLLPGILAAGLCLTLPFVPSVHSSPDAVTPPLPTVEELQSSLRRWEEQWNSYRFGHKYDEALDVFREQARREPENPVGYLSLSVIYLARMMELYTPADEREFYRNIDRAIEKCDAILKWDEDNVAALFYSGGAHGYKAIWQSLSGDWFGAWGSGRKGISNLNKTVAFDSTVYDAYYGLGVFRYWRSQKSRIFWWLPFIDDEREQGIAELQKAVDNGYFVKSEAKAALVYIFIEEKRLDDAFRYATELYNDLSYSRFYQRQLADACLKTGQGERAETLYRGIYESLRKEARATAHNLILYRFRIGESLFAQQRYAETLKLCKDILADTYPEYESKPPDFKRRIGEVEKLRDTAQKMLVSKYN